MLQNFLARLRHWVRYRPERRYMRGSRTDYITIK